MMRRAMGLGEPGCMREGTADGGHGEGATRGPRLDPGTPCPPGVNRFPQPAVQARSPLPSPSPASDPVLFPSPSAKDRQPREPPPAPERLRLFLLAEYAGQAREQLTFARRQDVGIGGGGHFDLEVDIEAAVDAGACRDEV